MPFIKPAVDFLESIKLEVDGGKATATGSIHDVSLLPFMRSVAAPGIAMPGQAIPVPPAP